MRLSSSKTRESKCNGSQMINATIVEHVSFGPQREKTCLKGFANNIDADQPARPRSLISAFVIRFLESTTSKLTKSDISIFFQLVSVAEETGLSLALSEAPKTGFLATRPIWSDVKYKVRKPIGYMKKDHISVC